MEIEGTKPSSKNGKNDSNRVKHSAYANLVKYLSCFNFRVSYAHLKKPELFLPERSYSLS